MGRRRRRLRTVLLALLCAVLALGCGAAEEQPIADVTEAPAQTTQAPAQTTEAPAQTTEAPAQTTEAAPGGEADQPVDGGLTAEEAIDAVEAAGLPIGERRDNTPQNCPDLGCEQLISTDYVSAYQWPTVADARHHIEVGTGGREDARVGQVVLLFGGNSDVWPYETAPYVRAVREAQ